jgi:hypothetical protein
MAISHEEIEIISVLVNLPKVSVLNNVIPGL